jgi:protein MpaA
VIETGDLDAPRRLLVIGCIHGNETSGIAIARRLAHMLPLRELDLWVVRVLNPDGIAANTRDNADGVDLNRKFPWRWRSLRGADSGPRSLPEPESGIAARLIGQERPQHAGRASRA